MCKKSQEQARSRGLIPTFEGASNISRLLIFVPGIMASSLAIKNADGDLDYFWPPLYTFSMSKIIAKMHNGLKSPIRVEAEDKVPVRATGLFPLAYTYLINAIERRDICAQSKLKLINAC